MYYSVMNLIILGCPEKPLNVTILAKTHNSITIAWMAGINGGSEQEFKVRFREKSQGNWFESQESISGLKTGESINYTINGLDAQKKYEITVVAINQFKGTSESQADVQTFVTEGKVQNHFSVKDMLCLNWGCILYLGLSISPCKGFRVNVVHTKSI